MRIIDVSVPLYPGCPAWPGDGDLEQRFLCTIAGGAIANTSTYSSPSHLGTHIDAPRHFFDAGRTVDQLDPSLFIGPALVVAVPTAADANVAAADLEKAMRGLDWPDRLLLKTRNSRPGGALDQAAFDTGFCALTGDAGELIAARGVKLVGIDYYSIGPYGAGKPAHDAVLGADIVALEGLDLRRVEPGTYTLVALPVKLAGFEGAPVRAVLVEGGL